MSGPFIAVRRAGGVFPFLGSPHKFEDGDEVWQPRKDKSEAHHFKTRAEAKEVLTRIMPNGEALLTYKIIHLENA